ncbi:MAG: DUF4446 family protein [Clostridia bacterium]|nr:DUF4446 family protein [Clostridia bacterium]
MDLTMLMFLMIGIIFIMVVICLVLAIMNSSRISSFMDYAPDGDLLSAVKDYYEKVDDLASTFNKSSDAVLENRVTACEADLKQGLRKTAIVNFDAYDDVTGGMSFALTVLDDHNDGIILTSLYGHNSSNTYIRKVTGGKTEIKLLDEEKQSLIRAIGGKEVAEND